jgi:hypothetical protein
MASNRSKSSPKRETRQALTRQADFKERSP